jgi:hypothetical protein
MMFKTRYNSRVPTQGTVNEEDSLTLQSEYPQTTIDYYLKRYSATGLLGDPNRAQQGQYLDVSEVGDFQAMQEKVMAVRNAFMELSAEERRAYQDDPALWLEAMQAAQVESSAQAETSVKETETAEKPADQGEH